MTKRLDRWITAWFISGKQRGDTWISRSDCKDIDQIDQAARCLAGKTMVCVGQIVEYKEQQGYLCSTGEGKEVIWESRLSRDGWAVSCDYLAQFQDKDEALLETSKRRWGRVTSLSITKSTTVCGPYRMALSIGLFGRCHWHDFPLLIGDFRSCIGLWFFLALAVCHRLSL